MSTNPASLRFPEWFPSDCPPPEASDAGGVVFRFAKRNPVAALDFLSHHELGLAPKAKPCSRAGLSVYRTIALARRKLRQLRERFPARFGAHIAEGSLAAEHGKIMQEGADPDHHEWWAYEGFERHALFRIAETLES
jgi:hypothetical protein